MYIDPAFGGMLLQVVLGIVAVGGAIVYSIKRRAKKMLGKDDTNEQLNAVEFGTGGENEMVDTLAEDDKPAEELLLVIEGESCSDSPSPDVLSNVEQKEIV